MPWPGYLLFRPPLLHGNDTEIFSGGVLARLPGTGRDPDGVPRVDGHDEGDQCGDLVGRELPGDRVVRLLRHPGLGQPRHGLGEGEGGALPCGEVRRLAPDGQGVETLFGLADRPGVLGVHVDAVGAAVELRGVDPDELPQARIEVDAVELGGGGLVETVHGAGEAGRVGVEVETRCRCHEPEPRGRAAQEYGPLSWRKRGPSREWTCTWS